MSCTIMDFGMVSAAGRCVVETKEALFGCQLPLLSSRQLSDGQTVPVFAVAAHFDVPSSLAAFDCRNNQLAFGCYEQIQSSVNKICSTIQKERIGVVVGSSTSGLDASEAAFMHLRKERKLPLHYQFETQHAMGSLAKFIAALCGAKGPAYTVSTACSSASKAMLSAKGLIDAGICDVVITGGVDSLCDLTVNGFATLGQLSSERMNPLSSNRRGLNIGEGGALFVLVKDSGKVVLAGGGESVDAYHISAPLPDGSGAAMAMERALVNTGIDSQQVSYVNLHGTATRANDAMETLAVSKVVPQAQVSSTKPFFGHCLGAAGAIEAAVCCISLLDEEGRLPRHIYDGNYDKSFPSLHVALESRRLDVPCENQVFLSNSFAFGGSNCSLVLQRQGEGTD